MPGSLAPSTQRPVYYAFDEASGSQRFGTLGELIKAANNVTAGCVWIDVQGENVEGKRKLLTELFLGLRAEPATAVIDELVSPSESDVVELQPLHASCVHGVVSCASGSVMFADNATFAAATAEGSVEIDTAHGEGEGDTSSWQAEAPYYSAEAMDASNGMVWCAFFASENVLVTLHDGPFVGLPEMVRSLEARFHPAGCCSPAGSGASQTLMGDDHACAPVPAGGRRFSTGFALATLVTYTSETMLPDPTALLSEVDCIDEVVLLIAPGTRDQPDLLRRVALLRRRISAFRARLYRKEKLLQGLVTPAMRGSFVSSDAVGTVPMYRDTVEKIAQAADRLDDARDILNQANLNFVTGVSMRMSQSSASLDFKMQILGQVATICLPLNLIASIFGMNCTVPWQSDTHPTLHAFFGIIGVMIAWCLVCSIPTIRDSLRGNQAKAIVPSE